jgi:hypothetical protein
MFNNDYDIVIILNDSQGRIKDMVKNIYSEFMKVHQSGGRITTTSSVVTDLEGELGVRDRTSAVENYSNYLKTIIHDRHAFIKDELVNVIAKINVNTSQRMIKQILNWMSDNYGDTKYHSKIDEFLGTTVIHSFYLLSDNESVPNLRDYPTVLVTLKNLYLSTRSSDKELLQIRELGDMIVAECNKGHSKMSGSLAMASRTAIILYIMLRVLVGKGTVR